MGRTIGEFMEKLRDPLIWEQISGIGTDKKTSEWVLEETVKAVLMGDEMAKLHNELSELVIERDRIIRDNPEIQQLNREIAEIQLKIKNISNWMDVALGKVYTVLGAKMDNIREQLELPIGDYGKEEVGMEIQ